MIRSSVPTIWLRSRQYSTTHFSRSSIISVKESLRILRKHQRNTRSKLKYLDSRRIKSICKLKDRHSILKVHTNLRSSLPTTSSSTPSGQDLPLSVLSTSRRKLTPRRFKLPLRKACSKLPSPKLNRAEQRTLLFNK